MEETNGGMKVAFAVVFCILTVLCWCPIGYGSYGEVSRIFGMPSWAAILLLIGGIMFLVEWVYLFKSDFALYDERLDDIMTALKDLETQKIEISKED